MAIDPSARGGVSGAHVSLHEAGAIARGPRASLTFGPSGSPFQLPSSEPAPRSASTASRATGPTRSGSRSAIPHTPVVSNGNADPDQWDALLNRMGQKHNVPPMFLKAVMLIESGGRPDAVGDSGHSVGLFQ